MIYLEYDLKCESYNDFSFDLCFVKRLENMVYFKSPCVRIKFSLINDNTIHCYFLTSGDDYVETYIKSSILREVKSNYKILDGFSISLTYRDSDYSRKMLTVYQLINRLNFILKEYGNLPVKVIKSSEDAKQVVVLRICNTDTIAITVGVCKDEDYNCLRVADFKKSLEEYRDFDRVLLFSYKSKETLCGVSIKDDCLILEGLESACFPRSNNYM